VSRLRLVCLTALAVVGISAVASASASALTWKVGGVELAAGAKEEITEATEVTENFILKTAAVTIECGTVKDVGGFIEGTKANGAAHIDFSTCAVTSSSTKCEVKEPIQAGIAENAAKTEKAEGVVSLLEGVAGAGKVKFEPKKEIEGKKVFTEIVIKSKLNQTCGVAKNAKVIGTATGNVVTGVPALKQPLEFTKTSGSALKLGTEAAEFTGTVKLGLKSGSTWEVS
jgi:hypothetical protein